MTVALVSGVTATVWVCAIAVWAAVAWLTLHRHAQPVHAGATERWSPLAELTATGGDLHPVELVDRTERLDDGTVVGTTKDVDVDAVDADVKAALEAPFAAMLAEFRSRMDESLAVFGERVDVALAVFGERPTARDRVQAREMEPAS